ncbi:MAG: helix-turn-helix domain-containing protein [Butyribacter sp.]|nr:helix-turn-helix domain-containing protein [bacterium]MDY3854493.1 helix-turn-helix domain-containing protein [Butyribacter sp.]
MLENYDDILLPEEAAEILKIGMNQMYKILNTGELKAYRVGRSWRIPKENIINYINQKTY